jgi:thiol-disulfide isomerase/thioredoxin
MIPHAPSIAACALLAAMSCRHSALSKGIDALISRITADGPSAKRPPHIALEPFMPRSALLPLTLALAFAVAGCDRESTRATQPQENSGAEKAGELTGKLDRSHAGAPLPAVTVKDPDGTPLELAALSGQPVLLNLWATWCAPCVIEMPMLDALAGEQDGRLRVVTVSQDLKGAEEVEPFFAQNKFAHLEPWLDSETELSSAFADSGGVLPTTVLYGADGKEVWRVIGGYDWGSAEAKARVAEAFGG